MWCAGAFVSICIITNIRLKLKRSPQKKFFQQHTFTVCSYRMLSGHLPLYVTIQPSSSSWVIQKEDIQFMQLCQIVLLTYIEEDYDIIRTWLIHAKPPSVVNKGNKWACSLEMTLINLLKSASFPWARNSNSATLRSRSWGMLRMWSRCGCVIHSAAASSATNASSDTMWSRRWTLLAVRLHISASPRR